MICIQKIYGFHGINRQNIEKSWYVTPVTEDGRTNGKWKIEQCSVGPETAKIWFVKQYSNCFVALLTATFNWWKFLSENICFQLFHANRKFPTYGETPSVYGGKPQHLISSRASSSLRRDAKAGRPGKISKLFDNINVTFLRVGFRKTKWNVFCT